MKHLLTLHSEKILQHKQEEVSPEEDLVHRTSVVHYGTEIPQAPVMIKHSPLEDQRFPNQFPPTFTPKIIYSVCLQKNAGNEASDMEGVPAVTLAAPVLSCGCHLCHPVSNLSVWLLPSGRGTRIRIILVILVEVAIIHHAETGGGTQVLAAALVLLNGLMERPQLAQQGHVLLTQTHLEGQI